MHHKTREAMNARRRSKYAEKIKSKKLAQQEKNTKAIQSIEVLPDDRTPAAHRKALQRARDALPGSPSKFVSTVSQLIQKSSPRKRRLFHHSMKGGERTEIGHLFLTACQRLKSRTCAADRQKRQFMLDICQGYRSISHRASLLGFNRRTLLHAMNTKALKLNKIKSETSAVKDLAEAYIDDAAAPLPDKKLVSKKTGKGAAQLKKPLRELFDDFCQEKGKKMSFSRFAKCRPRNIRLMTQAHLRQCLCEYCTNVELTLTAINTLAATISGESCIKNERRAVEIITCDSKNKACCYGDCSQCGVHLLDDHVQPLLGHDGQLTWHCWESKLVQMKGRQVNRKVLVTKRGDIATLLTSLKKDVEFLAQHLFRADWQHRHFCLMRDITPFPAQSVCMVLDFAENFTCMYQQEIQAAHWHHDQVTVHPIVTFYRCPACESTVRESLIFISADMTHDHHAVVHFTKMAVAHLREIRGLTISHITQWTDGCASQYKSKGPFADIACALADLDATLERNFFGSRHGKGPSDGESAVVKHHATVAVKAGNAVIATAQDLYQHCITSALTKQPPAEGCQHSLRSFFGVGDEDVQRDRPDRKVMTVPGTRSFHSVKSVGRCEILTRHLACSCTICQTGVGVCKNSGTTGPWAHHVLQPIGHQPRAQQANVRGRPRVRRGLQFAAAVNTAPPLVDPPSPSQPPPSPIQVNPPSSPDQVNPPSSPDQVNPPSSPVQVNSPSSPVNPPSSPVNPPSSPDPVNLPPLLDEPSQCPATPDHQTTATVAATSPTVLCGIPDNMGVTSSGGMTEDHDAAQPEASTSTPAQPEASTSTPAQPEASTSTPAQPEASTSTPAQPEASTSTPAQPEASTSSSRSIQPGSWVQAKFVTKKGVAQFFKAVVLEAGKTDSAIKCLRRKNNYYVFPEVDDVSLVSNKNIKLLQAPDINGRFQHFFSE